MKNKVAIVIPIYKPSLTPFEQVALDKCVNILGDYPIYFVAPKSLHIEETITIKAASNIIRFPNHFFKGIAGYNQLMLSRCFYEAFTRYEYILIYQLDAYIFEDDLINWCNKEYDYIGGPWLPAKKYEKSHMKYSLKFLNLLSKLTSIRAGANRHYHVGNGGFSLRKTESFLRITIKEKKKIDYFLSRRGALYHEDVFWGVEIPHLYNTFKVPHWKEALAFAFDIRPRLAYKYFNNKLPMGCHGWFSEANIPFWREKIHELSQRPRK